MYAVLPRCAVGQAWVESQFCHFLADDLRKVYKMGLIMPSPTSQSYWEASDEGHLRPQRTAAITVVTQTCIHLIHICEHLLCVRDCTRSGGKEGKRGTELLPSGWGHTMNSSTISFQIVNRPQRERSYLSLAAREGLSEGQHSSEAWTTRSQQRKCLGNCSNQMGQQMRRL